MVIISNGRPEDQSGCTRLVKLTGTLVMELADLYEVIDAVMATHGIQQSTVLFVQQERRDQRGGFEKRLKLLWVDDGP